MPRKIKEKSPKPLVFTKGDLLNEKCPSRVLLKHVASQWGVLIFLVLLDRPHRFSEMRKRIGGVSEKMLAQTLRLLESDGFVLREVEPTTPPRVCYSLTPLGIKVGKQIMKLGRWIEDHLIEIAEQAKAA